MFIVHFADGGDVLQRASVSEPRESAEGRADGDYGYLLWEINRTVYRAVEKFLAARNK